MDSTLAAELTTLASHLSARRAEILRAWRQAVAKDSELTSPSALPRNQFNDHIPELLEAYELRLKRGALPETAAAQQTSKDDSAKHGLLRWQQGYHLREVMLEWGHLQLCLVAELENYSEAKPNLDMRVMRVAWRALAELCSRGVNESATAYFRLRQAEATGHVQDLELTISQVRELERQRAELLRQAAHDLRGHVGVVKNVTVGLGRDAPEETRERFLGLLQKSVESLNAMLEDVMNLARLTAGQEKRQIEMTDVTEIFSELSASMEPLARERGLYLHSSGPPRLEVECDRIKLRRIAQNLLLNALKYTVTGGVTVTWGESRDNDPKRWMLSVQDTGPGFHSGPGAPLVGALKVATQEVHEVEHDASASDDAADAAETSRANRQRVAQHVRGEGIGLSIVKRLCDLLDASVEVDSVANHGTTFRVVLPRHYEPSHG